MLIKGKSVSGKHRRELFLSFLLFLAIIAFVLSKPGEPVDQSWGSQVGEFLRTVDQKSDKKRKLSDSEFVRFLKDADKDSFIVLAINGGIKNSDSLRVFTKKANSTVPKNWIKGSYVALIKNKKILAERFDPEKAISLELHSLPTLEKIFKGTNATIKVESADDQHGKYARIFLNGVQYADDSRGWNGLVLNRKMEPLKSFSANTASKNTIFVRNLDSEEKLIASLNRNEHEQKAVASAPQLQLQIRPKQFEKIRAKRNEAVERKILFASSDDYVPAKIIYQGSKVPVKVRLKGDWTDHLRFDRWSYRVKTKGQRTILGMKIFSLQSPETRGNIHEWLFHRAFRREGGIAPRYSFVELQINEQEPGTYALEEHFEKRMIEHHARREGPILKFDEDHLWKQYDAYGAGQGAEKVAPISLFRETKTLKSETLRGNYQHGQSLLEKFRSGELKTSEVFDVELMATYVALSDLFGSYHGLHFHNLRLYYNPLSRKLEPISFDTVGTLINQRIAYRAGGSYNLSKLFEDIVFVRAYFKKLQDMASKKYLEELLRENYDAMQEAVALIRRNTPDYRPNIDRYRDRREQIAKILALDPIFVAYSDAKHPLSNTKFLHLQLSVLQNLPVEIVAVVYQKRRIPLDGPDAIVTPKANRASAVPLVIPLTEAITVPPENLAELELVYRIPGIDKERIARLQTLPHPATVSSPQMTLENRPTGLEHPAFVLDEVNHRIIVRQGTWKVENPVTFPSGYTVTAEAGAELDLVEAAYLISFSPLHFIGDEESAIVVRSSDGSGQGLYVLRAKDQSGSAKSKLKHVRFLNLTALKDSAGALTGAVTFYDSPVEFDNCLFSGNTSEDALNIVSSRFEINKSTIEKTLSDAFDSDFSSGRVQNTTFVDIGNDALDFSGSSATLQDITVSTCGDKGVSVGERSSVKGSKILVKNCQIGLASKDQSELTLSTVRVEDVTTLASAYQKKPEYGPAQMRLKDFTEMGKISMPYLIEKGSQIYINGEQITPKRKRQERSLIERLKAGLPIS